MTLFRKAPLRWAGLIGAAMLALTAGSAAAESEVHIEDVDFSFEGPFGSFDTLQLQRGLKVYTEVCAACHGLKYVPIRTIGDEGGPALPADQVRAYAASFPVNDAAANPHLYNIDTGETRVLEAPDNFPANNAQAAPDLSLMAKARAGFHGPYGLGLNQLFKGIGGPEYIHNLMVGYVDPPECGADFDTGYYNKAFAKGAVPDTCKDEHGHAEIEGSWIAMPPPLSEDLVTYDDGTAATVEQMSMDVSAFLMWAAEPHLNARKQTGFVAVFFLTVLAALLYLTNKRLWADVKGKKVTL
jgi:ubiquinol-cytochrome c reductase cytochrome c1 subunit